MDMLAAEGSLGSGGLGSDSEVIERLRIVKRFDWGGLNRIFLVDDRLKGL